MNSKKMNYFKPSARRFFSLRRHRAYSIGVHAFDHDGCLGIPHMLPQKVALNHLATINFLKQEKEKCHYEVEYVTSFSNRQSILLDSFNALLNENNLAYPVVKSLAKAIGAHFDPLLLADISAQKIPGYTVGCMSNLAVMHNINLSEEIAPEALLNKLYNGDYAKFIYSEDKINILYAQMQRFALMHPDKTIHFNVYDDLLTHVLSPLNKFYSQYLELIPQNMTLTLNHYSSLEERFSCMDNLPQFVATIQGSGKIDANYYQTIQLMNTLAAEEEGRQSKYHLKDYLTPESIFARKKGLSPIL